MQTGAHVGPHFASLGGMHFGPHSQSRRFSFAAQGLSPDRDRRVAVSPRGLIAATVGAIGILTLIATTIGGCDSASPVIWTSDANKAVVEDAGGGFVGPPPTGSTCGYGVGSYTFTPADNQLAWHYCDTSQATAGTPFQFVDGSRTVNAAERTMLVQSLEAVVLSPRITCGVDKSTRLLTVTRPSGAVTYRDSFYSCQQQGIYVDGIDAVFNTARQLGK